MYNSFRILTISGFLLVTILGFSSAHAFHFENDSFFNTGPICLEARFGNTADGTPVQTFPCSGFFSEQWNWEGLAIHGIGTADAVTKCLDVVGGGTADFTKVQLFQCNGTGAQQWAYQNGQLMNLRAHKCLHVDDPGKPLMQATIVTCSGLRSQRWTMQ